MIIQGSGKAVKPSDEFARIVVRIVGALLVLPFSVGLGGMLGAWFAYGERSEDLESPSGLVTVMAVWDYEEDSLCRSFPYQELVSHLDTLRLRFALTQNDLEQCEGDFSRYDPGDGWPRKLTADEHGHFDYGFEVESARPLELIVHASSGDATFTRTRYRVDDTGAITDVRTMGAGPGAGLGPLFGAGFGLTAWLLWVAVGLLGYRPSGPGLVTVGDEAE